MKLRSDYRLDYTLNKGDQICTEHAIYTITGGPLGFGGSSILYPARRKGSDLDVAIKEWFPKLPANFERRNGIIQPKDPNDTVTLEENRKLFEVELKMGEQIRNATALRAIHLWGILKPTKIIINGKSEDSSDVSKGLFAVMERMDQKGKSFNQLLRHISEKPSDNYPLKTGGLPNIHTTSLIMEQVLLALQRVHEAGENGYVFGDIQDGNIYFADCRLEQGDIGTGMLLDFGCTKPLALSKGRKAYEYQGENIFSSQGYIPPEIAKPEAYDWELTGKADIYSAGCLMLRCLLSRAKIKTLGWTPYYRDDLVDEVDVSNIGCSESNRRLVNHILENAMMLNPKDRSGVSEMLKDIQKLKQDTEPPKYLLPTNLSSPDYWVPNSRAKELDALAKSVNDGETVFLHGIGGIGKTECAIKLAKRLNPPRGAYLVHFQGSMKETILKMEFTGYKFEPKQKGMSQEELEEAEYRDRLEKLKEHYQDTVLIIDNFDVPGKTLDDLRREPALNDFLGLNLKRIFTTRYPVGRKDWEIRELSEAALLELMRYYCTDSSITDEQYLSILKEIQNHTLTAMLIAKTLEESWGDVTPEMILEALRRGKLSHDEYPEVVSDQNRGYQQKQIYEHLKVLFDLSGMNVYDRTVLCWATLIPHAGIDAKLFRSCLESDEKKALQQLVKRGWLNRTESILKIHPVIREVCRNELINIDKDRDNNLRFLNMLLCNAEKMQYEPNTAMDYTAKKMSQVVAVCEEAAQRIGIVHITEDYWKKINNLLKVIGNHHLCKQIKSFYPSVGQTRIPYAENDRTNGMRSFILDESNNVQYTVGIIGVKDNSEILVKILATTSSASGNQQLKTVYISLDEMCEASCVFVFAFHKDIQVMYRYVGYFSPMGVMLNPNPLRVPRVFIYNQGNDRKTMVRVVEFSIHEVSADLFGGRTVEEAEGEFEGKVILVDPNNTESILLSGSEIQVESQYYADFIFRKQDGISFMH